MVVAIIRLILANQKRVVAKNVDGSSKKNIEGLQLWLSTIPVVASVCAVLSIVVLVLVATDCSVPRF